MKPVSILLLLFVSSALSVDAGVAIRSGFGIGQTYLQMEEAEKRAYVIGAINGMLLAPLFGAPQKDDNLDWIESYTTKMTDAQLAAILTKYLKDHPGEWHETLNVLTFRALKHTYEQSRPKKRA